MFAVVAVALRLAQRWHIAPISWPGTCVLDVYRRYLLALPPLEKEFASKLNAIDRVRRYIDSHRRLLRELDESDYPALTDRELDEASGFLRSIGGTTWLIIRASRWNAEFGGDARTMLSQLLANERLKATDGFRCQIKVRKSKRKDGVYCIRID
jgi:hypothetical protein